MIRISKTFANGVWIGNASEKLKISGETILTGGWECRPEVSGFRFRPRSRVRDRAVLTTEAAGGKKSARGGVALLLAELARRKHRQQ
jgi:hypothetical protein